MSFIKIDQGIQILQLKKDPKLLLFSLLFSECFYLHLRKPTATKSLLSCITYVQEISCLDNIALT